MHHIFYSVVKSCFEQLSKKLVNSKEKEHFQLAKGTRVFRTAASYPVSSTCAAADLYFQVAEL